MIFQLYQLLKIIICKILNIYKKIHYYPKINKIKIHVKKLKYECIDGDYILIIYQYQQIVYTCSRAIKINFK